jgi:hypothetical protein
MTLSLQLDGRLPSIVIHLPVFEEVGILLDYYLAR